MGMFFDNLRKFDIRLFLSPDDGGGDGGGEGDEEGEGEGGSDEKTYTEEELAKKVEAAVKKRVGKLQRDLRSREKKITEFEGQVTELSTRISDMTEAMESGGGGEPDEKLKGQLEMQAKQHERQQAQMRKELAQAKADREEAEKLRRVSDRDRELDDALTAVGCKSMKQGRRYFIPQLQYEDGEGWMFKTEGGNLVTIDEGVLEELPDNLKPSSMSGGSGSQTGSPKTAAKRAELDKARKELVEARNAFRQDGGSSNASLAKAHALKKRVAALEAELKS
jgi:chromosome segregation ATPase